MSAYGKYQNAYKRASVNTMDQNKLIVMLYDGAIKNITFGVEQMRQGNVEKTHNHLVKSKNIVAELMASLNMDKAVRLLRICARSIAICLGNCCLLYTSPSPRD